MARYPGSIWRSTDKFGYDSTTIHTEGVKRVIIHSAEGYRAGMFATLDGPRQASWHFSIMRNGEVYQHINTANIAWTAGSFEANDGSIQFEEEGVSGEALTPAQYASTIALLLWVFQGYSLGEPDRETNLREHNEFIETSCPNGRVPWSQLIEDILKELDMTEAEFNTMFDKRIEILLGGNVPDEGEMRFRAESREGVALSNVTTLKRWLGNIIEQRETSGGSYTDAQAVQAVKDRL